MDVKNNDRTGLEMSDQNVKENCQVWIEVHQQYISQWIEQ